MGSSKGRRRMLLGQRYLINLNYSGGVRKSPGGNPRSSAVKACAKNKDLASRKTCFGMTSGYKLSDAPKNVKARAKYAAKKGR